MNLRKEFGRIKINLRDTENKAHLYQIKMSYQRDMFIVGWIVNNHWYATCGRNFDAVIEASKFGDENSEELEQINVACNKLKPYLLGHIKLPETGHMTVNVGVKHPMRR